MDYRVNFSGGIREGQTDTFPKKIGGYVRLAYEDGTVEEYHRISDDEDGGTYVLQDAGSELDDLQDQEYDRIPSV